MAVLTKDPALQGIPVIDSAVLTGRVDRVREVMRSSGLDALVLFSHPSWHGPGSTTAGHVRYLTNVTDPWKATMLVLPLEGRPTLLCGASDSAVAEAVGVEVEVSKVSGFGIAARRLIEARHGASGRFGVVGRREMSADVVEGLLSGAPGWKVANVDGAIGRLRMVKGPEEVARHRIAGQLSDAMHAAVAEVGARPGTKGWQVLVEMEHAARSRGAEMARAWIAVGHEATRPTMFPWENTRDIVEGDPVFAGNYVIFEGYWGHAIRAAYKGKPTQNFLRLFDILLEVQDAGIASLRPGLPIAEVNRAMWKVMEGYFPGRTWGRSGHGLGLDYSDPVLSDAFVDSDFAGDDPGEAVLLEPGMVVELHPGFRAPELGCTAPKIGDMFLVTESGSDVLTKFPREIISI